MRNKKWLIVAIILLAIAGFGIWWWQSTLSDSTKENAIDRLTPEMKVATLNVRDIDSERIKAVSRIILKNPFPIEINTNRLSYEIYIDSTKVIEDAYDKPIRIASSDSAIIEMPMEIMADPLARVLKYFNDNKVDSADYFINATFQVDVPIAGEREFSMNVSERLPAFRLLKIQIESVDLNVLNFDKEGIDMVVQVINPNVFPLGYKNINFSFNIEKGFTMKGVLEKTVDIPANGTQNISMHAEITEGNIPKAGWQFLTDKKDTRFQYVFNSTIISQSEILDNSSMTMSVEGTLDEIVNVLT